MNKDSNPPEPHVDEDRREEKRRYHQQYWSQYKKVRRRVSGTLSEEEHAEIERRAEEAGRAVWKQIHAEAEAYARGEYLPSKDIEERINELIVQLRRIGNNVNQIARALNTDGNFEQQELVQSLEVMETLILEFVRMPWSEPASSDDNDTKS